MTEIDDRRTIPEAWNEAVARHGGRPFLVVPPGPARGYLPEGVEITYRAADAEMARIAEAWHRAGWGSGHRVAALMENRPDYLLLKMALNSLGVSLVPINPEYRAAETAYLLDHSEPEAVVVLASRGRQIGEALAEAENQPPVLTWEEGAPPPAPARTRDGTRPTAESEACILYTSGTTGRPKGCKLSHGYEIACGARYASLGGLARLEPGAERIYNPLPLYHLNAAVVSLWGAILTGGAQIQSDRFRPDRWWPEIDATRATIVHYLGVIVPLLLGRPPSDRDARHDVRFGIGAGVEPQLHAVFEARFGFPLLEIWGMTEMCRVLGDCAADRRVGERALGRAYPGVDVEVVDEHDRPVPDGTQGEMVVRHSAATPRRGAFSGYLKNAEATEEAWRGGWFHTGDVVWRGADGMLHFVDRRKNIIRRSGENIAAAEIEALLLTHPDVAEAAVMAVKDEVREEEVLACVVLRGAAKVRAEAAADAARAEAEALFGFCHERLAYYKAPGWLWFSSSSLPVTGSQKLQKHAIFPGTADPRVTPGMHDLRSMKRRG